MKMVRIKFLKGMADAHGSFVEPGQIIAMSAEAAHEYLKIEYDDGSRLAIEVNPTVCPKCGHQIEETQGPAGAPESLESATMAHTPRRR
jgi:hypothetical protein